MQAIGSPAVVGPVLARTTAPLAATHPQQTVRASIPLTILQRQSMRRAHLWSRRPRRCSDAVTTSHAIQTAATALPAARSVQSHDRKNAAVGVSFS